MNAYQRTDVYREMNCSLVSYFMDIISDNTCVIDHNHRMISYKSLSNNLQRDIFSITVYRSQLNTKRYNNNEETHTKRENEKNYRLLGSELAYIYTIND